MKKILSLVLALCILMTGTSFVFSENISENESENFIKVKIPFPDTIEQRDSWLTYARYKDSGEVIPLSMSYFDNVYATIPAKNKDRELEAFVPEELEFTDEDTSNPNFHAAKMLSRVGVIRGNENGEAKLSDNVTRAEAVAMIMRFIGLEYIPEAHAITNFDDVYKTDWYYPTIMGAYKCGIVKGDSEKTFSPNRDVTREELTVMVSRALQYADLRCSQSTVQNNADEDKISEWAKDAYHYIGRNFVSDYDDTDPENPVRILNPQKSASRADVVYLLYNTQNDCQLYPSETAEQFGFDKQMPIIDGSTSTYPFTECVYNALFCNGQTHPKFPYKHSKSHASYQRLINGEVDMLFASVYPASDILKMAEDKGVELELIPIAYDAMIFFTNKDNPATGLTKEQISNIYVNDAYDNWKEVGGSDALLYPYCRNNDSGSHAQMEKHFLNGKEIHPEVQKETSYTMSNVLTDVMAAKTDNPVGYGLGYSIYYYYNNMDMFYDVHNNLKLLAIDGVLPTEKTIADGSYPLSNNTYVVLRKDTSVDSPARKMAEFMLTEAGQQCVENAGYGRLKKDVLISENMLFADKLNTQMPKDKNYMFSPLSIKMALTLAANGALGETQEEILNAVGISNINEFNNLSKDLIERYSKADILNLNIANSIWLNKDKTSQNFSDAFNKIAVDYYNADVKSVDGYKSADEINEWVSNKTNGKINEIIKYPNNFWSMLVNAIYFKGAWQDEFSVNATKPEQFNNADGTKITTDFMNMTKWFSYAERDSVKTIKIPYQNRIQKFTENGEYLGTDVYDDLDVSMYLMMSDNDVCVEQELTDAINDDCFNSTFIKLSVPKFKIENQTRLNDMLVNMGIVSAFDFQAADFKNMFDSGNMCFTNVLHKTYISVDEKGTEAAAVTAIHMAGSALPPEPVELKFNKPFYFIIRDNTSGETLFMGRYAFAE